MDWDAYKETSFDEGYTPKECLQNDICDMARSS